ncbi:ATP-binding cassette subfamily B protein [Nonomuraea muscovyensis]|uniref:ATP-binding cassette subfamily B protein n=1 Tax=Nonomuraea muscovyensis TaxID=1124761 RepID=A0A7X0C7U2_9ACTN|nr:ABC transporter ATP-binding protein [Nonomuraea muscovyensis]MBB6349882.1 ATP-binding cassette subfamily B protein [Nonomuraea muscovyensis]
MAVDGVRLSASAREAAATGWSGAAAPMIGYALTLLGTATAPVAVAWLTKLVIDGLTGAASLSELLGLAAGLAGTGVAAAILPHASRYLGSQIGRAMAATTTDRLFAATARFPGLRPFEDPRFLDRLRLAQEGTSRADGIVTEAFGLVRSAVTVIGFVGSLLVISPAMTLIVLCAAVPALVAQLKLSRRRTTLMWEIGPAERRQLFYSTLLSTIEAAKEIRLFNLGGFLRGRLMAELSTAQAGKRRMDRKELSAEGALALLSAVVAGGGLVWAIAAARTGTLTVGDVSMFTVAVVAVQGGLDTLVNGIAITDHNLRLFGHYVAVLRAEPDLVVPADPAPLPPLPPLRRGIELRDVWFRYSDDHPWILRGVDLFIPYGAAVALVGLNGAGKSTLVKLLCRFYDPSRGAILWDGADLRDVRPEALRERISGVFQDHMAYDFSARDNIGVGDVDARDDLDRIRAAARMAGVDELLAALPRGYDTLLTRMFASEEDREDSSTGVVLSGGQWQRTALARAFLRDGRDLMILDEPSSGLDPEAEADVHARMRHHRAGQTSLLISHRLNTVRDADLIVVLKDGAVAERGSHDELMAVDGTYARLFRLQARGYHETAPSDTAPSEPEARKEVKTECWTSSSTG